MMLTNEEASKDAFEDSSLDDIIQNTSIEEDIDDDYDDNNDIVLQADLIDADLNDEDVEIPTEVSEYITTLESQTQRLERELEKCDQLLMYLPHQSMGNRQAVVLYEDSRQLNEAAAEHGLSVEEFTQKVLNDLDQEHFTEEDVKREFEEFSRLQEELNELRSAVRLGTRDEVKAILPLEDDTVEGRNNSHNSEETILALCNGDVGIDADCSHAITAYTMPSSTNELFEGAPLVSSTALSTMRDYVLEQLRTTEQQYEVKVQTLNKSIEKCKQEEEAVLLYEEKKRKTLQQEHNEEEAAMLERLKENERLDEEEQKVKNEQTTQELNLIQTEIDQLSEVLEKEKQLYKVSRQQWMEQLDTARKQAAVQIQKVYRGYRARQNNSSIIDEMKEWKKLKKEEKYKLRIMEVDYEIKYQEEKVQKEKERQEKEAAEEKMKKEEEERRKEDEQKRKEEEDRIIEEFRKEKERKNEEQKLAKERQRKEEEELRKEAELKRIEEERLRKEEEKKRNNDEKKKQKEKEDRKKEEKRRIKEEEKRRKNEEKQIKEEETKTKGEKNVLKEGERIKKGKQEDINKEGLKEEMKEDMNIKEETIIKENKEIEETDKRREELQGNNEAVVDKEREKNNLKENMKDKYTSAQQVKENVNSDIIEEISKTDFSEITKVESETRDTKFETQNILKGDNLLSNDKVFDLVHNAEKPDLLSKNKKPDISCTVTVKKHDISYKDEKSAKHLVCSTTVPSPPAVSMTTDLSPFHSHIFSHAKGRTNAASESTLCQPLPSVTSPASFQETNLTLTTSQSQVIHQQRLNWMKSCIPWSKISCEPWRLKQMTQKSYKRPTQAKRLPPLSEAVILDKAHAASLRQVNSIALTSLPECSLATLGQCWSLRYLTVTKCGLMCLEGLGQCKHLLYINAEDNNIEYMDLKDLGSLQVVRLAHNNLSVIHGIDGCINLRSLDLSHNRITRISGLGSLRRVHTLNLSHNQLVSSDGLEEAVTVQDLNLSHNYLQRVTNISKLCLLNHLTLAANNLLQVPELQNQVLLQTLCLQENSIKSLEPVSQYWLPLLHTLNCSQNMLESVTGISSLILLSHLDVGQNQITEMENLLPGIRQNNRLETLVLEGNPLLDVYTQEYRQLVMTAVPSLKFLDHLLVESQAPESDDGDGANLCHEFIQMCLSQASLHTALQNEFDSQMKVLLVNQHVTGETLCSTCFTFCDTSFKMASEHRSAHEYGDTSTTHDINHVPMFTMNEKAKFHSITGMKPQPETMADRKHTLNVSGSYTTADKNVSDTDSILNVSDKMVNSVAILDKENGVSDNQSDVTKDSNSVTLKSLIYNSTEDKNLDANMQPDSDVSKSINSTNKQDQRQTNSMKSRLGVAEADKTARHFAEVELSLSERSKSNRNTNYSNSIYHTSATGSTVGGINRVALPGKLDNSMQDNNFTVKTKEASIKLQNNDQFGLYLSGRDKFEIALQAQSSTNKMTDIHTQNNATIYQSQSSTTMTADVQTQNNASIYQSTNGNEHMLLSGVKANIVGGQLFKQDTSGISKDLELSAHDSVQTADLDNMEFDIDSFLDMGEIDEILELGWRPADIPNIPQSVHPVLGQIKATNNHKVNMHQHKGTVQEHLLPHPPDQPSQAWTNSPLSAEFKSSGLNLGAASPVTAPSPLSVTSTAETVSRGSVRSKKEELSEEWGFKDSRTVEMMLARAKKMKYNSERRRKLDKLDPQQKLHLLKKLEEKYRIKSTRSPSAKILPRKEYFKAREEEFHRQELEKQNEDSTRFNRMFEWLHTQVGDYNRSSSKLNPGVSSGYLNQDNTSSRINLMGHTHDRKSSPLSEHHKTVSRDAQQVRRYSSGETQPGHSTILPPIHESSLPSSNKKDRISFRDIPVEVSGGWGGGKKRGKAKS